MSFVKAWHGCYVTGLDRVLDVFRSCYVQIFQVPCSTREWPYVVNIKIQRFSRIDTAVLHMLSIQRIKGDDDMLGNYGRLQNILENHGAKIRDMLVKELIRSYISHAPADAVQEQMKRIVRPGDQGMIVDRDELAALIENARSAAIIDAMEWKTDDRERLLKTTIDFLRDDFLPTLDGREYAASMSVEMGAFLSDCLQTVSA